jgi:phosphoribosylanthranilate isomerase
MKGRLDGCLLGTCIADFTEEHGGRAGGAEQEWFRPLSIASYTDPSDRRLSYLGKWQHGARSRQMRRPDVGAAFMHHSIGRPLFHVKVCGVTTPADATLAAEAGADAVGFNFVAGSPRRIDPARAREATAALPGDVLAVGVFAGMPAAEMLAIARAVGLGAVQLHGHLTGDSLAFDPPERCGDLAGLPVIRAVRMEGGSLAAARRWLEAAATAGRGPDMVIVDASVLAAASAGVLGGTGHVVDWEQFAREEPLGLPLALAGGLTAANVAAAIRATGVQAVDTASGVEAAPGRKDAGLMRAFIGAAREALESLG